MGNLPLPPNREDSSGGGGGFWGGAVKTSPKKKAQHPSPLCRGPKMAHTTRLPHNIQNSTALSRVVLVPHMCRMRGNVPCLFRSAGFAGQGLLAAITPPVHCTPLPARHITRIGTSEAPMRHHQPRRSRRRLPPSSPFRSPPPRGSVPGPQSSASFQTSQGHAARQRVPRS